jgi:glycyl-tRNA synthetase beta subunit
MNQHPSNLQELLGELHTLQGAQEEETTRLRRRVSWLESRRRELFDTVSLNSSDFETRRKLEETERQLADLQQLLGRTESELKESMQDIRQRIIALRNEELTRLEQEAKALRQRKDEIHNELLPEAMSRVSTLQEEEDRLAQRIEESSRRMRELNKIELPTTQVA